MQLKLENFSFGSGQAAVTTITKLLNDLNSIANVHVMPYSTVQFKFSAPCIMKRAVGTDCQPRRRRRRNDGS